MLWTDDPTWIQDEVGRYLTTKMVEVIPKEIVPEPMLAAETAAAPTQREWFDDRT